MVTDPFLEEKTKISDNYASDLYQSHQNSPKKKILFHHDTTTIHESFAKIFNFQI